MSFVTEFSATGKVSLHYPIDNFHIPSGSMHPTLQTGDRIVVNMRHYERFEPDYGDVAVFGLSERPGFIWIMRVVGLPGDQVQMRNGQLFLNESPVSLVSVQSEIENNAEVTWFVETLPNQASHRVVSLVPNSIGDNTRVFNVPEGHVFMLGDNRDNSADSRFEQIGFVPIKDLKGKASFIYWPWARLGIDIHEQQDNDLN